MERCILKKTSIHTKTKEVKANPNYFTGPVLMQEISSIVKSQKQKKSIFTKEILFTYMQKNYILMALLTKNEYFHILQLMQIPQLTKTQKQHGMNQILKQMYQFVKQ